MVIMTTVSRVYEPHTHVCTCYAQPARVEIHVARHEHMLNPFYVSSCENSHENMFNHSIFLPQKRVWGWGVLPPD